MKLFFGLRYEIFKRGLLSLQEIVSFLDNFIFIVHDSILLFVNNIDPILHLGNDAVDLLLDKVHHRVTRDNISAGFFLRTSSATEVACYY
jgi:hypothetical protein